MCMYQGLGQMLTMCLQHHQGCLETPKCAYVIYGQPLMHLTFSNVENFMFFLISFIFSRVEEISMFLLLILKVLNVTNKGKKEEANTECNGSETFSAVFCEHQHLQNFSLMSACISSITRIAQQPHNNFHNLQQGTGFIL